MEVSISMAIVVLAMAVLFFLVDGGATNFVNKRAEIKIAREHRKIEEAKRDRAEHERVRTEYEHNRIS